MAPAPGLLRGKLADATGYPLCRRVASTPTTLGNDALL